MPTSPLHRPGRPCRHMHLCTYLNDCAKLGCANTAPAARNSRAGRKGSALRRARPGATWRLATAGVPQVRVCGMPQWSHKACTVHINSGSRDTTGACKSPAHVFFQAAHAGPGTGTPECTLSLRASGANYQRLFASCRRSMAIKRN